MITLLIQNNTFLRRTVGALLFLLFALPASAETVTDMAGREVELPEQVTGIILGEGRFLPALAILEGQRLTDRLAGIMPDFELADPAGYRQYAEAFPKLKTVPRLGRSTADSFSIEQALGLGANLAVFGIEGHGPSARDESLVGRLERAGVTVLFIDFRQDPLSHTLQSMTLLGRALDRDAEANAFIDFYRQELDRVQAGLNTLNPEDVPSVFLHSRVGLQDACCETMTNGMLGRFLTLLNADNIATERVPGVSGIYNLEYLLLEQPDIYIATAVGSTDTLESHPGIIALGAGVAPAQAEASLRHALSHAGLAQLQAVQQHRAFAIWHHFYNSPLNVVAVQAFARWLYPDTFAELDPQHTLTTLYQRFQPVPLNGTYWIGG
ncbi:ABC transporter substrate-binding protein [Oceanimonas doudoroffii]|uniref:Iron ABC transporter substrate-binding protein n=1 Tax=Oceanimonas doudoroffii TaxID=84158 RepID=A0A233RDW5_9GAMM|nr:ABC transporter substrate-binding protein [Oceanimonas doudoroffii]OXY81579.1 iron ABC transporter substrate-binding protein [Oceanimonas doudoroffii]